MVGKTRGTKGVPLASYQDHYRDPICYYHCKIWTVKGECQNIRGSYLPFRSYSFHPLDSLAVALVDHDGLSWKMAVNSRA